MMNFLKSSLYLSESAPRTTPGTQNALHITPLVELVMNPNTTATWEAFSQAGLSKKLSDREQHKVNEFAQGFICLIYIYLFKQKKTIVVQAFFTKCSNFCCRLQCGYKQ